MAAAPTVLYVARHSVYKLLGHDCWDIDRDARTYDGPHPIIAHPPCGHWGKYRSICQLPGKDCGPIAIAQVRRWGGILEHPLGSQLFTHCGSTPEPGTTDFYGGTFHRINQRDWGHFCHKATWLYVVGLGPPPPWEPLQLGPLRRAERLSRRQLNQTPPMLAAWLTRWLQAENFPGPM